MSYLVLARKWRPQAFEDVIGQRHVTRTLQNAIRQDRLAHALLFSGPRGVGKTSVARILAKAINCETGPTPSPCNQCGICKEITSGASVDVQEIDGASNRGIDEVRQLRENIKFRSTRCRFRVYIIDEVHMLTKEAFNALLKTLEEPPPHVYFIFATTEPQRIPATIHSRCQHYEFRRLSVTELADHLETIVKAENLGLDRQAVTVLAREARGGVRDSLSLLDQVAAYGATSAQEVCEALGVVGTEVLKDLAMSLLKGDLPSALKMVDQVYGYGMDIQVLSLDLVKFMRDLAVLKLVGPEDAGNLVELSPEEIRELSDGIRETSSHTLNQALEILLKGQETVHRSSTPRLALEMLLIKVASAKEVVGIDRLLQEVDSLLNSAPADTFEPTTGNRQAVVPEPMGALENKKGRSVPPEKKSVSSPYRTFSPSGKIELEKWAAFIKFVGGSRPALASVLKSCKDCRVEQDGLFLRCTAGMNYEVLTDQTNIQRLKALLKDFFGADAEISVEAEAVPGDKRADTLKDRHSAKEELIKEPLVQEALRVFRARIAEVKPEVGNR